MNSYLITAGSPEERLKKSEEIVNKAGLKIKGPGSHPDLLQVKTELSIGISQIRQIQKFLSRKPYQALIKAVIVPEGGKMTIPAQNSFLKTLEEPPANSLIVICSQNQDQLLSTIVSRCQLIRLTSKPKTGLNEKEAEEKNSFFKKLASASAGKRLQLIEPYTKNREEAIDFCRKMILVLREKGLREQAQYINEIQACLKLLQANVNVKLSLENLVLKLR